MDIRSLIDGITKVANIAATVIPGAGLVGKGAEIGGKILDVIDGLQEHATPDQQPAMQAARAKLAEAVKAKAKSTSDRLRG